MKSVDARIRALVNFGISALRGARYLVQAAPLRYPKLVECNVCGWEGRHLISDGWHLRSQCPKCRSEVRHRLLVAALAHRQELSFERLVAGRRVLHFAPERLIENRLRELAARYVTADFLNPRCDFRLNLSEMPGVAEGEFDLLVACDVLEHVPDDRRAMREIHRVLAPGGYAILTVPQKDGLAETFEDPSVTSPAERERLFGQHDHLRIHGDNFASLLEAAGFDVTTIDEHSFSAGLVQRHVLVPPARSERPLATNFRKIFFARK